jgi:hypothetical protein
MQMSKLSDIKVGDRISFHGGTGVVVERTRGALQIKVRSDLHTIEECPEPENSPFRLRHEHANAGLKEVWITDAKFWFDRGDLQRIDEKFVWRDRDIKITKKT